MTERQIINRVKKIKALEAQKKALEEQIDSLKAEIQEEMKDQEVLAAGDYTIHWTTATSNRLDSKGLKATFPDIYKQFTKQTASRRFQIA